MNLEHSRVFTTLTISFCFYRLCYVIYGWVLGGKRRHIKSEKLIYLIEVSILNTTRLKFSVMLLNICQTEKVCNKIVDVKILLENFRFDVNSNIFGCFMAWMRCFLLLWINSSNRTYRIEWLSSKFFCFFHYSFVHW